MTDAELVRCFIGGIMKGSQDDRNAAKAAAEEFRKHGPIKRIAFRIGNKVIVYERAKHAWPRPAAVAKRVCGEQQTCTACGATREWSPNAQRWMYVHVVDSTTIRTKHADACGRRP